LCYSSSSNKKEKEKRNEFKKKTTSEKRINRSAAPLIADANGCVVFGAKRNGPL
jgi:hypothetical protein